MERWSNGIEKNPILRYSKTPSLPYEKMVHAGDE